MKNRLFVILALSALAATVWSTCDPPADQYGPTCASVSHPNVPDSTYSSAASQGASWLCCNQDMVCNDHVNSVRFGRAAPIYVSSLGLQCVDMNNLVNLYSVKKPCCGG